MGAGVPRKHVVELGMLWHRFRPVLCYHRYLAVILKKPQGGNLYEVTDEQSRHLRLKCVYFGCVEDLGDLIFCTKEDQNIWVAKFHSDRMEVVQDAEP